MKKNIIILSAIVLTVSNMFSQTVLLNEDVDDYNCFSTQKYGVNGKHFIWGYMNLMFSTPSIHEAQEPVKSGVTYTVGLHYKLKIFNWCAVGTGLNYYFTNYSFKNNILTKTNANHNKVSEKFLTNNLGSEFYLRFNIGKHGNAMGNYIDIGAFGSYIFSDYYKTKISLNEKENYSYNKRIVQKNMAFTDLWQYGAILRVGNLKHFSIICKYRFSDIVSPDFIEISTMQELPKFSIGIEYNIYR